MAEKEETKIVLERTYNVPLRKEWLKSPKWKRTKKASRALREFLQRHMKSDDVKIGPLVNEKLWHHGIKNPPHHIKVVVKKDSTGIVTAELEGTKAPVKAEPKKKGVEKKIAEAEKPKVEEKKEEVKEEKKEEAEVKEKKN